MTHATSGRTSRTPFAYYDPDSSSLRMSQGTFPWDSTPSSVILPRWGSMRSGALYERPKPVLLMPVPDCSSLLPTPVTSDAKGASESWDREGSPQLRDAIALLPTPTPNMLRNEAEPVEEWEARRARVKESAGNGNGFGVPLTKAVQLLPTPRATDGSKGGPNQRGSSGDRMLPSAVQLLPTPTAADGDRATRYHCGGNPTLGGALLPTPTAREPGGTAEEFLRRKNRDGASRTQASHLAFIADLLPTPRSAATRTSRLAALRQDSMSAPSLEQAIELAAGEMPREFTASDSLPPSWSGASTSRRSGGGKRSSDDQLPGQLSLGD